MALAIRAVSAFYVNNANSGTVPLPAGAAVGDSLIIFASHGYSVTSPSGFTVLNNTAQSNYQGATFAKTLVTADITAGSVTINFGGVYYGDIVAVCLVGAYVGIRYQAWNTNTGGASSRSTTTDATPLTGDLAIFYGSGRANAAITSSQGAALANNASANSSFVLTGGNLAADGALTETWGFPTVPSGDYNAVLVLTDTTIPTYGRMFEMAAEVMRDGNPSAQTFELAAEVLRDGDPSARMFEIGIEVLRSVTTVLRRRPTFHFSSITADAGIVYPGGAVFIDGDALLIDTDSVEFS